MFWRGETCYFWWMPHTTIWYVFMWAWWAWTLIDSSFHKHDENNSPTVYIYIISQQQRGTSIAIFLFQPNCYFLAFEPDSPLGIPRRTQLGTFCWIMLWRWKKDHIITFDFGIAGVDFNVLSDPKKFVSILWSLHLPDMINPWLHQITSMSVSWIRLLWSDGMRILIWIALHW